MSLPPLVAKCSRWATQLIVVGIVLMTPLVSFVSTALSILNIDIVGTKLAPQYMAVATVIVAIQRRGPNMSIAQFTKTVKRQAKWTQMT